MQRLHKDPAPDLPGPQALNFRQDLEDAARLNQFILQASVLAAPEPNRRHLPRFAQAEIIAEPGQKVLIAALRAEEFPQNAVEPRQGLVQPVAACSLPLCRQFIEEG